MCGANEYQAGYVEFKKCMHAVFYCLVSFEIMLEVKWLKIIDMIFRHLRMGPFSSSSSALQSALFSVLPVSVGSMQNR